MKKLSMILIISIFISSCTTTSMTVQEYYELKHNEFINDLNSSVNEGFYPTDTNSLSTILYINK